MNQEFFNLYNHGFIRVAVADTRVDIADPAANAKRILRLMDQAAEQNVLLMTFPELGLSGYSCDDLFHQQALLDACRNALAELLESSREIPLIAVVGLPLKIHHLLFNCAVVFYRGRILGVVPKTYLPNHREFYELRQFAPADRALQDSLDLCGQQDIPFGTHLVFQVQEQPLLTFAVEICEDLWVPIPPSSYAALAGATVLVNLSASNITIGKADYRRQLVANQSGSCLTAYLYCSAGGGESTTDLAWDGHGMICENGRLLAESMRFSDKDQLVVADIDLERLSQDRMRQSSFGQSVHRHREDLKHFRTIPFSVHLPRDSRLMLSRPHERFPYVPGNPEKRDERCHEVYAIQVQGLVQRLRSSGIERIVIGVSGGLDSTQALLVCAQAMDILEWPRDRIIACILPGYGSTERTQGQARRLTQALGCETLEVDIRPACEQMFKDIGHPYAEGEPVYDLTFENVQAGQRTSYLFRLAGQRNALVVGTSDLSELALGWCTYGVGDHMAHYHVNVSVPKTLMQYLIRWSMDTERFGIMTCEVLQAILDTEISPELVPGEDIHGQPVQRTEDVIGPYELHDFFLYYILRFGYSPPKVAFLAYCAWRDCFVGQWPDIPPDKRRQYDMGDIKRWLGVFLKRFFQSSQYKRSCVPNAPKVGSGGSLSPRGDYRAPSDAKATTWMAMMDQIPGGDPYALPRDEISDNDQH